MAYIQSNTDEYKGVLKDGKKEYGSENATYRRYP